MPYLNEIIIGAAIGIIIAVLNDKKKLPAKTSIYVLAGIIGACLGVFLMYNEYIPFLYSMPLLSYNTVPIIFALVTTVIIWGIYRSRD